MGSATQNDLIEAAQRLMLHHGYAATGINDICEEAGVTKGALYHLFSGKEELTLAALESFHRRGMEELTSIALGAAAPRDRLLLFVEAVAERAPFLWQNGCLVGGLASETALASDTLQRSVARYFDQVASLVELVAEPFVASLPTRDLSARDIAEDFLAVVEGAIVLARAHRDPERIRAALRRYASSLRRLRRS